MNQTSKVGLACLLFGLLAGASLVYEMVPPQEPRACERVRRDATPEIFRVQNNLLSAVNARGDALGKDDYAREDAKVMAALDDLDAAETVYNQLFDECEAAS